MNFDTEKKGYSKKQVDEYIAREKAVTENVVDGLHQRISELTAQNEKLKAENDEYANQKNRVSKAIMNAVAKAEEIDRLSKVKYNREIAQLKAFHEKWTKYYAKIIERYPLDDELAATEKFTTSMDKILGRVSTTSSKERRIGYITVNADESAASDDSIMEQIVPGADKDSRILSGNFDPLERISKYYEAEKERGEQPDSDFADRSESGFSFEEALNPTEELSEIMKDLGIIMDD